MCWKFKWPSRFSNLAKGMCNRSETFYKTGLDFFISTDLSSSFLQETQLFSYVESRGAFINKIHQSFVRNGSIWHFMRAMFAGDRGRASTLEGRSGTKCCESAGSFSMAPKSAWKCHVTVSLQVFSPLWRSYSPLQVQFLPAGVYTNKETAWLSSLREYGT